MGSTTLARTGTWASTALESAPPSTSQACLLFRCRRTRKHLCLASASSNQSRVTDVCLAFPCNQSCLFLFVFLSPCSNLNCCTRSGSLHQRDMLGEVPTLRLFSCERCQLFVSLWACFP